jgi:hypothetical protein
MKLHGFVKNDNADEQKHDFAEYDEEMANI